jgi:hypothetical protein
VDELVQKGSFIHLLQAVEHLGLDKTEDEEVE